VRWPQAFRVIASRFPPVQVFERLTGNPAAWDVLAALDDATNPRLRDAIGDIRLVPPARRVSGPGASFVMAPFTHVNPKGSRFSDGSYGVYYAARALETAIRETAHHFARFARDSRDPPRREDMRVLLGKIAHKFDDLDAFPERKAILDPNSYAASRPFGAARRAAGSDGIAYPSVRHEGGRCIAAFWPDAVGIPVQERHLRYEWDGTRVTRYFDFRREAWFAL
jgi:hypothetical protein